MTREERVQLRGLSKRQKAFGKVDRTMRVHTSTYDESLPLGRADHRIRVPLKRYDELEQIINNKGTVKMMQEAGRLAPAVWWRGPLNEGF